MVTITEDRLDELRMNGTFTYAVLRLLGCPFINGFPQQWKHLVLGTSVTDERWQELKCAATMRAKDARRAERELASGQQRMF